MFKNVYKKKVAVRARFELAVGCYTYGSLANSWFKPAHPPHQT